MTLLLKDIKAGDRFRATKSAGVYFSVGDILVAERVSQYEVAMKNETSRGERSFGCSEGPGNFLSRMERAFVTSADLSVGDVIECTVEYDAGGSNRPKPGDRYRVTKLKGTGIEQESIGDAPDVIGCFADAGSLTYYGFVKVEEPRLGITQQDLQKGRVKVGDIIVCDDDAHNRTGRWKVTGVWNYSEGLYAEYVSGGNSCTKKTESSIGFNVNVSLKNSYKEETTVSRSTISVTRKQPKPVREEPIETIEVQSDSGSNTLRVERSVLVDGLAIQINHNGVSLTKEHVLELLPLMQEMVER